MTRRRRLAIGLVLPLLCVGFLALGILKTFRDPYEALQPYVKRDRTFYTGSAGLLQGVSERIIEVDNLPTDQIEALISRSFSDENIQWSDETVSVRRGKTWKSIKIGRFALVQNDNVHLEGPDYLKQPFLRTVRVIHHMNWFEVAWTRIKHIGNDPFA